MDRKGVVAEFLQRCIDYSNASITRKTNRGEMEDIANLEKPRKIDVDTLEHKERSSWISGLLSPRPLVLASTENESGVKNLAPLTSVMSVSTSPPLLIASMSRNREGKYRDTLINLRSNKKAILHMMPSTLEAADWIDNAGTPIPPSQSEWDLTNLTPSPQEPLLVSQAIAALEVEMIEERELPDAVAKLIVLRVTHIWTSLDKVPLSGVDILCHHGIDRLTPAPDGWSKTVDKHYGQN